MEFDTIKLFGPLTISSTIYKHYIIVQGFLQWIHPAKGPSRLATVILYYVMWQIHKIVRKSQEHGMATERCWPWLGTTSIFK